VQFWRIFYLAKVYNNVICHRADAPRYRHLAYGRVQTQSAAPQYPRKLAADLRSKTPWSNTTGMLFKSYTCYSAANVPTLSPPYKTIVPLLVAEKRTYKRILPLLVAEKQDARAFRRSRAGALRDRLDQW